MVMNCVMINQNWHNLYFVWLKSIHGRGKYSILEVLDPSGAPLLVWALRSSDATFAWITQVNTILLTNLITLANTITRACACKRA